MKVTKASLGIGDLHFSNSPARRHTKKQLRKAVNMFAEQGIISPIVVDSSYRIIDGHLRVLAARELGIDALDALVLPDISNAQRIELELGWCQTNQLKHQKPWERGFYEAIRECHSARAASRFGLKVLRFESDLCEL